MKCPFCQQELEQITTSNPLGLGRIEVAVCKKCMDKGVLHIMPIWDWQELIRTRKALDVANEKLRHCVNITVEELDELKGNLLIAWNALVHFSKDPIANNALKKITALEQKD